MKVILYMASTINGLIAKENDDVTFVSEKSWKGYLKNIKRADCVIIGRRTYEMLTPEEFVKGVLYVIFTRNKELKKKNQNVRFTDERPKRILESLKKEGIRKVALCGGGNVNSLFLKANLIDEICLDIEPTVFGKGIRLFAEEDFEAKLKLIGTKKLSPNEIQLHYKVLNYGKT